MPSDPETPVIPTANENVVSFTGPFYGALPVSFILENSKSANLESVVVIGRKQNGKYFLATSSTDAYEINWMIDRIKNDILDGNFVGLGVEGPEDPDEPVA